MNIFYLLILILILILCSYMMVDINLKYNLNNNIGTIRINLFKIPIFIGEFSIKQNIIEINRNKKKLKINLDLNQRQLNLIKQFRISIANKVYIDSLYLNTTICMENAFEVAIISGIYRLLSNYLLLKIYLNNKDLYLSNVLDTGFRHQLINVKLKSTIYASIFDILWAVIYTIIWDRREYNEERKKRANYRK